MLRNLSSGRVLEVLVIGLDGVPFEYLDPLLERGQLPNLAGLINRGFRAPLRSVYPPMTPVAWPSFATGKNPGKHGVFGWWELKETRGGPMLLPVSGRSVQGRALWEILGRQGLKVGVMNVPITFPAREVNGFLVAGLDNPFVNPESGSDMTYPTGLLGELEREGINYKVLDLIDSDIAPDSSAIGASLERWIEIELERTKAARFLIQKYEPHFMMIVYHMADYFMHRAKRDSTLVESALVTLDRCIGSLLEECGEDTCIIVMSDHGSIELKKYIYLQNWLVAQGLLKFKEAISSDNLEIIAKAQIRARFPEFPANVIRSITDYLVSLWQRLPSQLQHDLTKELSAYVPACCMSDLNIDWAATRAFTISSYGEIYINVQGRQPSGIVEPGREYQEIVNFLIRELSELRDPDTGEIILSNVVRKEDCYFGDQLDSAPDVLCFVRDPRYYFMRYSYYMRPATTVRSLHNKSNIVVEAVSSTDDYIGDHTSFGILIAAGGPVSGRGVAPPCQILDLAPTILSIFGIPVPLDMDGKVLAEYFRFPDGLPTYISAESDDRDEPRETLSAEDVEHVRKKLRSLGYNV